MNLYSSRPLGTGVPGVPLASVPVPVPALVERGGEPSHIGEYGTLIVAIVLAVILLGAAIYAFFPKHLPPTESLVEGPYQEPGNFADYTIIPDRGVQPYYQWYLTPLQEETIRTPYYPYLTHRFHNVTNPVFS